MLDPVWFHRADGGKKRWLHKILYEKCIGVFMSEADKAWEDMAMRMIKSSLSLKGVKYPELVKRLRRLGIEETTSSLSTKINRGTFKAAFMLQVLKAIDMQHFTIPDID